jgi:hypothetical protein
MSTIIDRKLRALGFMQLEKGKCKNHLFVKGFLAVSLALVILISACFPQGLPVASAQATFTATELLGRPTDTSVTINAMAQENLEVYFEYGTQPGVYTDKTANVSFLGGSPIEMVIGGLQSNAHYFYRMVYRQQGTSNWIARDEHSFQTQRSSGSTFTFTLTSDSHVNISLGNAATWQQTITNIASDKPDFEIDCGDTFAMDNVNTLFGAEQAYLYQRRFFDVVGNSAAVFLAVGNHEQQEAWHLDDTGNPETSQPVLGANAQKKFYPNPVPDSFYSGNTDPNSYLSGDNLREDYYAWTWGDALFVVIDPYWYTTAKPFLGNTGGGETSDVGSSNRWDWTLGLQQFKWLNQTLQDSPAKYKFIFAHHMTGGADNYGGRGGALPANLVEWGGYNFNGVVWGWDTNRPVSQWGSKPVHQIMVDTHVTAFFHGHDHQYAYGKRDGIVYQSLPAAGFSGNGFNSYSEGTYTLKALPSPGHLRVTVSPLQVAVDYIMSAPGQPSNGQATYTYTINTENPTPTPQPTPSPSPTQAATTTPQPTAITPTSPRPTQTPKPSPNPTPTPAQTIAATSSPSPTPSVLPTINTRPNSSAAKQLCNCNRNNSANSFDGKHRLDTEKTT